MYDYLIIGAGLYGAVFAQQAKAAGKKVLVIDKRDHIAGNVYTTDQTWPIICELHEKNPLFSGVNLSRNRGHQNALLAGQAVSVQENVAMLVGMCLYTGLNYLGQRFFVFKVK